MKVDLSLYSVALGHTERYDCPVCGGHNTFTVTNNEGTIIFNCYRAGCNSRGAWHKGRTKEELKALAYKESSEVKPFKLPEYIQYGLVNSKMIEYLRKHHCLDFAHRLPIAYDPRQDRILFLIKDGDSILGAVGRDLSGKSRLKSLNYHDTISKPFIIGDTDTIVIVEDCTSACSLLRNPKYTGLALLGTNLKSTYIPWIKKYDKVIVALDKDARNKSLVIKKHLSFYCNDVSVWLLEKDIKDMEEV